MERGVGERRDRAAGLEAALRLWLMYIQEVDRRADGGGESAAVSRRHKRVLPRLRCGSVC